MASPFSTNRPQSLYAALFLLIVATLFGGATRYEVGTTILPRLAALGVLVYFFWRRHGSSLRIEPAALIFWLIAFAIPLLQLMPLPWSVWTSLPGRGLARDILTAVGEQPARPISLSPSRTLDFLLAMFVPLAAYLLGSHLDFAGRTIVLRAILLLALLSAVLGLIQLSAGQGGAAYFYTVTNADSSVGFFSNANHLGLFLAGAIVIALAWLADSMAVTGRIVAPVALGCGIAIAVLLFGIAGTSSRAAAIFSVVALLAGLAMLPLERIGLKRAYVLGGSAAVTLVIGAALALVLSGRVLSDRFRITEGTQERVDLLPRFAQVIGDYFPFGSGLGSFEPVFKTYEKAGELNFGYWNQAHQDYAQVAIEAGFAGIALILAFLIWYAVRVVRIWYRGDESSRMRRQQAASALFMVLILLHGMGDYPMRTATIACVFGFLAAFLTVPQEGESRRKRRSKRDLRGDSLARTGQDDVPDFVKDRGDAAHGGSH